MTERVSISDRIGKEISHLEFNPLVKQLVLDLLTFEISNSDKERTRFSDYYEDCIVVTVRSLGMKDVRKV